MTQQLLELSAQLPMMVDDGDTNANLNAGINDNASNAIGRVKGKQHRYQYSIVDTVRTCNSLKPFSVDIRF